MQLPDLNLDLGWYSVYILGYYLIDLVDALLGFLNTQISIPLLEMQADGLWQVVGRMEISLIDAFVGGGLVSLLVFKLVKWILDIVL